MSFNQFSVNPKCLDVLESQGIHEPTPVQEQAIPEVLDGHDLVAVAQTGTGKTLAFGLPAVSQLAKGKRGRTRMLVLTPTRELAQQVEKVLNPLAKSLGLRTLSVFGGVSMQGQTKALRQGVDIVIATPGRLLDHINRRNARLGSVSILVLDEADRMLEMGFLPDMRKIISDLPQERQTLLFSATFPKEIQSLANSFQNNPKRIEIGAIARPVETVSQSLYAVEQNNKTKLLVDVLGQPDVDSVIVFMRTKYRTDRVAKQLTKQGFRSQAIHGDRSQGQRDRALDAFRKGKCDVLVATDVAARGIDINNVTHVVNYDVPKTFDDYVHRIGRTGRAKQTGSAFTFVTPQEHKELRMIESGLGSNLERVEWEGSVPLLSGFKPKSGQRKSPNGAKPGANNKPRRRTRSRRPARV